MVRTWGWVIGCALLLWSFPVAVRADVAVGRLRIAYEDNRFLAEEVAREIQLVEGLQVELRQCVPSTGTTTVTDCMADCTSVDVLFVGQGRARMCTHQRRFDMSFVVQSGTATQIAEAFHAVTSMIRSGQVESPLPSGDGFEVHESDPNPSSIDRVEPAQSVMTPAVPRPNTRWFRAYVGPLWFANPSGPSGLSIMLGARVILNAVGGFEHAIGIFGASPFLTNSDEVLQLGTAQYSTFRWGLEGTSSLRVGLWAAENTSVLDLHLGLGVRLGALYFRARGIPNAGFSGRDTDTWSVVGSLRAFAEFRLFEVVGVCVEAEGGAALPEIQITEQSRVQTLVGGFVAVGGGLTIAL